MTRTSLSDSVVARGLTDFGWRSLRRYLRQPRFLLIQGLVIGIALGHGGLEFLEMRGELPRFADGILRLPPSMNMVPVVLAALWYGVEGGLMTALLGTLFGTPNIVLFHLHDFEWIGEVLIYGTVIVVALLVAVLADREATSRVRFESASRHLDTLREVTDVLTAHQATDALLLAVSRSLVHDAGFPAVGFAPARGITAGPVVVGEGEERRRVTAAIESLDAGEPVVGVRAEPVEKGGVRYGLLIVSEGPGFDHVHGRSLLSVVAKELGVAIESVLTGELRRADLQRYARALTVAQEAERRRIARDLHDETAQSLVLLARGLGRLAEANDGQVASSAADLRELSQSILRSLRSTIWALRPPLLDDLGLAPAIESLIEDRSRTSGCRIELEVVGTPRRLASEVELAAYRLAQEAIANVERHSGQLTASVVLDFSEGGFEIAVSDPGCGFDTTSVNPLGLGLTSMRERADMVSGEFIVESAPGRGSRVVLSIPAAR